MNFSLLKDFMDSLTAWRIPGNSISVCLGGNEVFSYQSGFADIENKIRMTPDRLFYIYSCSKVATVTAALQLYEQGKFLLDDPLYDFIPEFKDMYIRTPGGGTKKAENVVTLRHLFTMTSGLNYNTHTAAFEKSRKLTDGKMDTMTVIRCLAEEPLSFEPGTQWQYGLSHDVLAGVIETVTGKRFSEYMQANVFEPLGMRSTFYHVDEYPKEHMLAQQYRFKNSEKTSLAELQSADSEANSTDGTLEIAGKENHDIFGSEYDSGGAGIVTSVGDYSRLCCALANGGRLNGTESILSPGTIDLLRTNQLTTPELIRNFNWEQLRGYGYGLGVRTLIDKTASGSTGNLGEFGWGGAAGSTVLVDPDINLSVFYTHHMLNPQESYYQPRLRNVVYACLGK